MKKHLTNAALLFVAVAFITSCASNRMVWVKRQPANETIVKNNSTIQKRDNSIVKALPSTGVATIETSNAPVNTTVATTTTAPKSTTVAVAHTNKTFSSRVKNTLIKVVAKVAAPTVTVKASAAKGGGGKSQIIALILCIVVGGLGIHRFYLGYIGIGILELLTGGVCGILWLIDLIRIITGDLKPKDGDYDQTL